MKILVVDDHVLIREAMRGVLRELKGEAAVILEASDSRQAMRQIEQNPDVELVLLDLGLPDRDGLEMLSELGKSLPDHFGRSAFGSAGSRHGHEGS